MKENRKNEPLKTNRPDEKEFGGLRCPKPECRQVLFEIEKSFLVRMPESTACRKCESKTMVLLCSYNESEIGKLIIRFWCSSCREGFDCKIPSIRKYCHGCKTYHHIFLYLLMNIPQFSSPSEETTPIVKLALKPTIPPLAA